MNANVRNILCPIDLSGTSLEAVQLATSIAQSNESKLIFLYVAMQELPRSSGYAAIEVESSIEEEKKQFEAIIPTDPSVEFESIFIRGNPMEDIVRIAKEQNCDLIVMTTHGRSGLTRLLLGSVAEHVIRHAPCPVLSLKTPANVPVE